ncbi:MAG: YceI family protein [Nitrospiraceae bacterium]
MGSVTMRMAGLQTGTAGLLLWLMTGLAPAHAETAKYNVDLEHSTVGFSVDHLVVSKTKGQFMDYTGFIEMDPEAKTVKTIEAAVKTISITTNHQKRDAHLKSPDFFDVEKFPTMTYKLKSYRKNGEGYEAVGDLTLKGVTKEVTLVGNLNGVTQDPWGNTRAGFTAEGKINRKEYGINWSKALDNGGLVVGDDVFIKLDIECIKAK